MFVALDLPAPARAAIADWRDGLVAGRSDLRPVAPEALHVTLAFLDWQAEADAERIAAAAFDATSELRPPLLTPTELRAVPSRRPRLFALDLADEDERSGSLQAAVSAALEAGGFYKPEQRPFWPHVTLARVKRGARATPLAGSPPPAEPFSAAELTLYRSTLRPQGALYESLARMRLGAAYG
jgi:RNA 2',3'-cyclic 3'-phosphodiesterase